MILKPTPLIITALLLSCTLVSCLSPKERTISDNDIHVSLKIKDISDTKLKFVTRGIGLEKIRGFQIIMTVEDRNSIVVYERLQMKSKPKRQYLNDISSTFKINVSPDKKHFAISYLDTIKKEFMYHLLPKGRPFAIDKYTQQIQDVELKDIDWKNIPSPEKIITSFIKSGIKKDVPYYPIKNPYLWDAILANMPNDNFNELIVTCWPNVYQSKNIVDSIMEKTTNFDNPFFNKLEKKAKIVLKTDTFRSNVINAIVVEYILGNGQQRTKVFEKLIPIWPESPTLLRFVTKYFSEFPTDEQAKIITKSVAYYKQNSNYYYKDLNKDFLNEFADSLTLKNLMK